MTDLRLPRPPTCECLHEWNDHGITNNGASHCFTIEYWEEDEACLCSCERYAPKVSISPSQYRAQMAQMAQDQLKALDPRAYQLAEQRFAFERSIVPSDDTAR